MVRARQAAQEWKATTALLPNDARLPGVYDGPELHEFVLPREHRWLNLLPEAREVARSRFEAAEIHWHHGRTAPNPHLCSSQIQCLNALAPLVDSPDALAWLLGEVLPIAEILPFGALTRSSHDDTDHVVFEWTGTFDHLGEWRGAVTRGSHATSADAAIRYRARDGAIEVALIEWKYTETYPFHGRLQGDARYHAARLRRYRQLFWGVEGPFRTDLDFGYEDLFAEPIYQLARTQALAARMEATSELGADRVRFVWAAPGANLGLLREALGTMRFEAFAREHGDLPTAWAGLLRQPDRFSYLDTSGLLEPGSPVSDDFRQRYEPLGDVALVGVAAMISGSTARGR